VKKYYVYILTSNANYVLYTGMTNDLVRRVAEHREHYYPDSFSARYQVHKLVYFEIADTAEAAIHREKQIKNLVRRKKLALIQAMNPEFRDLYPDICS